MPTTARRIVTFRVRGKPEPKGSTKAFVPKGWAEAAVAAGTTPRAIVTSDNPKLREWQQSVRDQAQRVSDGTLLRGAVAVDLLFHLSRPASRPSHRFPYHLTAPDVDKLARACLDALKGVLYTDDSVVIDLHARKCYAALELAPGVDITAGEADPPPIEMRLFARD